MKRYRVAVDIGGTFVDSILFDAETGRTRLAKASTTPDEPARGVLEALSRLGIDLADTELFVHGTTLGLNAVIQRRGVATGIITNAGFRDIFEIGRGDVPAASMYDFRYQRPPSIVPRRYRKGVAGRIAADGSELEPLDEAGVVAAAGELVAAGLRSIALCFLHSYRNPSHEERAAALICAAFPSVAVSASSAITREYREYERTATAVVDAYINPIFNDYVGRLERGLVDAGFDGKLLIMRSAGGAMTARTARQAPIYTVLSGPAGGLIGASYLAREIGRDRVLTLDYGGTSLDAAVIEDGEPLVMHEAPLADLPALIPIFDIRCIGAGGGSIAWVQEGLLQVGPHSAGSQPGPIAYGRGGTEPTTTDAAFILGFLDAANFLGGSVELDVEAARAGMEAKVAGPLGIDPTRAAAGIFDVLVARTAGAIREITVERGRDPRDFSMLAFGGAGPMIAPLIAREVENAELIVPQSPAVFSAWGMLMSDVVTDVARTELRPLDDAAEAPVMAAFDELVAQARAALADQASGSIGERIVRLVECRYVGQEHALEVEQSDEQPFDTIRARFHALHKQRYGHAIDTAIQVVTLRVRASAVLPKPTLPRAAAATGAVSDAMRGQREAFCFARRERVAFVVYDRAGLAAGHAFDGPAIVEEGTATTVIHSDQAVTVDEYGHLIIRRRVA
ncbi:hydantoinase/oxoprolinase family protein [Sphingomonas sp. RHCKR7]|uniref:hydantoinase/oxoprolinase family protein n=1 Tax=Sphingomonas folli TaxID=2862497 RepID=UPI001CA5204E|nr:hydantoinase/oxoprolinase family protein [Sphingomonas folli]MBW6527830.1 hydantoinase/oxoprolinase family protein [Sphingomonas folli]